MRIEHCVELGQRPCSTVTLRWKGPGRGGRPPVARPPTLKRGDIVIIDNANIHKVAGVEEAIEAAGATLLYLPSYLPDLNPIEPAFSKFKAHLRKAVERTILGLLHRIGRVVSSFSRVVSSFSPQERRNFFQHAGYVRT
jgi:transposase